MRKTNTRRVIVGLVVLGCAVPAVADPPKKKPSRQNIFAGSPLNWQIEPIIDLYVSSMTRHYNLNQTQEAATRALMTKRVKTFLNEYEKDVRSLFAEYYYYRLNREVPSPEMAKDWAKRARPLAAAIQKEILDGNMEWRTILNEEQKAKHDRDLEGMDKFFKQFDEQVDRWSKGDVRRQDITGNAATPIAYKLSKCEDSWDIRVRNFIREYDLDPTQRQTAFSILREMRDRAEGYREARAEQFNEIETRFEELTNSAPGQGASGRAELFKRYNELERPICNDMTRQLLGRLEKIPTAEQRRKREAHVNKLSERMAVLKADSKKSPSTQPKKAEPPATSPAEGG